MGAESHTTQITIPTPLCLRSELAFTLPSPSPSSASSAWDLSIRPSLSNADSADLDAGATQVTGSFSSSPSLSLRWAPQLPAGEDVPLVVPRASLETAWTIDERGGATADVRVSGEFELAGLREKPWVDLEFVTGELAEVRLNWEEEEGDTPVLGYRQHAMLAEPQSPTRPIERRPSSATTATTASTISLAPVPPAASPIIPPLPRELNDFASPLLDDPLQSLASSSVSSSVATQPSFPFTPTPTSRRRPLNPRATEARPPSFTSLFDTAPPAPPVLDTSFAEMQSSPGKDERRKDLSAAAGPAGGARGGLSLMRMPAPFDPEASAMDMSFEVSALEDGASAAGGDDAESSGATEHSSSPVPPPLLERPPSVDPVVVGAYLRIQLVVSEALRRFAAASTSPDPPAAPTFACRFVLAYPPASAISKNGRLALPPLHVPAAQKEDALVVVSAVSPTQRVEVVPSAFSAAASADVDAASVPPSPLPALGRSARWASSRTAGGPPGPAVEVELRPVEVEERAQAPPPPLLIEEELLLEPEEAGEDEGETAAAPEQEEAPSALAVEEAEQDEPAPDADEPAALDTSTRTERPATPSLPTPAPSPPPVLPSSPPTPPHVPSPTRSLSHVRVEVTPFLPSTSPAPWRLLCRYVLAQPYTGELRVPSRSSRPLEGWDGSGAAVEAVEQEGKLEVEGLHEAVVEVEAQAASAQKGEAAGLELLKFEASVAKLVVVVSVPHGASPSSQHVLSKRRDSPADSLNARRSRACRRAERVRAQRRRRRGHLHSVLAFYDLDQPARPRLPASRTQPGRRHRASRTSCAQARGAARMVLAVPPRPVRRRPRRAPPLPHPHTSRPAIAVIDYALGRRADPHDRLADDHPLDRHVDPAHARHAHGHGDDDRDLDSLRHVDTDGARHEHLGDDDDAHRDPHPVALRRSLFILPLRLGRPSASRRPSPATDRRPRRADTGADRCAVRARARDGGRPRRGGAAVGRAGQAAGARVVEHPGRVLAAVVRGRQCSESKTVVLGPLASASTRPSPRQVRS